MGQGRRYSRCERMVITVTISDQAIRAKLLRIFDIGEKIGAYTQLNRPVSCDQVMAENKHLFDERVIILEEIVNLINHRD